MRCASAVLDNLPKVPHEKYDKLAGVVRKVISQVGVTIRGGARSPFIMLSIISKSRQTMPRCYQWFCSIILEVYMTTHLDMQDLRAFTCLRAVMSRE